MTKTHLEVLGQADDGGRSKGETEAVREREPVPELGKERHADDRRHVAASALVLHRDGDVAPEQLAEVDEAVPVDRVADDEDSRRVRSSFPQERDRIFATARGGARRQRVGGDLAVLFREDIGLILRR